MEIYGGKRKFLVESYSSETWGWKEWDGFLNSRGYLMEWDYGREYT